MVKTVIITDCAYRSSIAAIYSLNKLGESFIGVTTDDKPSPPAFHSKYLNEKVTLPLKHYKNALLSLCKKYDRPIILPIGVFTMNVISENLSEFAEVADFCVSKKDILDKVNDKSEIKKIAKNLGLTVPELCDESTNKFPVVVKPLCGEKFGLKASERYKIAENFSDLNNAITHYSKFSPIIIEEYVRGDGIGVSVVLGKGGRAYSAFCHKRLSEYPFSGGPSTSLVTFNDDALIEKTVKLLKEAEFEGIAMAEYKEKDGEYYLLEVNPRIWGSFSATFKADSDFLKGYLSASRGESSSFSANYKTNKKVKFMPNIFASVLSYAKNRLFKKAFLTLIDSLNVFVPNAVFSISDPLPAILDIFRKRR